MRVLFIHQNFPGQFRHLAAALARRPENEVVFVTGRGDRRLPGVRNVVYTLSRRADPATHHYLHQFEDAVLRGQAAARACLELRGQGFTPDIVIAHPGWGESLFVKQVWRDSALLNYGEFFYRPHGADVNFDPEFPASFDALCKLRARSAHLLLALEAADHTLCPTQWQKSLHPAAYHDRISVIFDGVDTDLVMPAPQARFTLPGGRSFTPQDEVVTYVARNLEPLRGFHTFTRALPRLCALRPNAQIVVVGGDDAGYGGSPPTGKTWRQAMTDAVPIDLARVHFVGNLDYRAYLSLLQVSSAHVYLTAPFVLSWSMMEAMASGCLVIGSDTPPVREMIEPGINGLLVDFFDPVGLGGALARVLDEPRSFARLRQRARETVVGRYSLKAVLPRHLALLESLAGRTSTPHNIAHRRIAAVS